MEHNINASVSQDQGLSREEPESDRAARENFTSRLIVEIENCDSKQWGIADGMRVTESAVSHWKDSTSQLPAWRLVRWTRVVGPGLLRWIARQAGYDLVPRDSVPGRILSVEQMLSGFSVDAGAALGQTILGKTDLGLWLKIQGLVNSIVEIYQRSAGRSA